MDYNEIIKVFEEYDEADKNKEVFAFYGLAMHLAQVLEQHAINMIVIDKQVNGKIDTPEEVEALWDKYDLGTKTLGTLIKEIKSLYKLSNEDSIELEETLKRRNYLTHDYFRFNANLFHSDSGKKRMIKDFVEFTNRASELNTKLEHYIEVYNKKMGFTDEYLEALQDKFKKEWQNKIIDDDFETFIK